MKEYRQTKTSLKKQISLLLPLEVYEGAKRDSQRYNRSMAYHIVETLRITYSKSIEEIQAEKEAAAQHKILQELKKKAAAAGKSEELVQAIETVFHRFAQVKTSNDFTEDFQQDIITFAGIMLETETPTQ